MLFSIGGFKFEAAVIPQSLKRSTDYGISSQERVQNHAALIAAKKQKEEIEIAGVTLPKNGAGNKALEPLYALAETQKSYLLTSGRGKMFGRFAITSVEEEQGLFTDDGSFLVQSFTLKLIRDYGK